MSTTRQKILFLLPDNEWHKYASETLWAEKVGANQYRLLNTPFFAKNVSFYDTVETKTGAPPFEVQWVISRGGHSTYRIYPFKKTKSGGVEEAFENVVKELQERGCRFESGLIGELPIYAFDIPPEVDAEPIYQNLVQLANEDVLEFEPAHDGHPPT